MKKIIKFIMVLTVLIVLTGCTIHASSYKALGFVRTSSSTSADMSFYSLDGKVVFKLKSSGETDIKYKANLEEGSATVYYEYNGDTYELFTINSGEEVESNGGYIEKGTVYIYVETDGKIKNGSFSFSVD